MFLCPTSARNAFIRRTILARYWRFLLVVSGPSFSDAAAADLWTINTGLASETPEGDRKENRCRTDRNAPRDIAPLLFSFVASAQAHALSRTR